MEPTSDPTIRDAAGNCAQGFVKATASHLISSKLKDDIQDQLGRFKIWAGNLGVFATSTASADYRLRDELDLKDVLISMLNRLSERLTAVTLNTEVQSSSQDKPHSGKETIARSLNSSSSSSLGLSSEEEFDTYQERVQDVERDENDYVTHIQDVVDRLFRLSASIRKPISLSENERIARFIERKEDADEIQDFERYVRWQIEQWCSSTTTALIDRLTAAALSRRRKLWYRQHHRQKLFEGAQDWFSRRSEKPLQTERPITTFVESPMVDRVEATQAPKTVKFAPTVTKASSVQRPKGLVYEKSIAFSNITKSAIARRGLLDVPPPPKVQHGDEVQCPYCSKVLKANQLKSVFWTRHVLKDLSPYVCLYEPCQHSEGLFESIDEWIHHMQWQHNVLWCCPIAGHESTQFHEEEQLRQHMENVHSNEMTVTPQLLQRNARVPLDPFSALSQARTSCGASDDVAKLCPLCNFDDSAWELENNANSSNEPDEQMHEDGVRRVRDHIANHLEKIALLSLPAHLDSDMLSSMEAQSKHSRNARSDQLQDVGLSGDDDLWISDGVMDDPNVKDRDLTSLEIQHGPQADWSEVLAATRMRQQDYLHPELDILLLDFQSRFMIARPHSPSHEQTPTDENEAIELLKRIPPLDAPYAVNIIRWLVYCRQPLYQGDLATIVAITTNSDIAFAFDVIQELRFKDYNELQRVCSGLLRFETANSIDGLGLEASLDKPLRDCLATIGLRPGYKQTGYWRQQLTTEFANAVLAKACLAYLFWLPYMDRRYNIENYRFSNYAARHWMEHALAKDKRDEHLNHSIVKFLSNDRVFTYWLSIYDPDIWPSNDAGQTGTRLMEETGRPLYYASLLGLVGVVSALLQQGADVNQRSGQYATALQVASVKGHVNVVKLLVGVPKITMWPEDRYEPSALLFAVASEHSDVVDILLQKYRAIEKPALVAQLAPAVIVAAGLGLESILRSLVEAGASADSSWSLTSGETRSPLRKTLRKMVDLNHINTLAETALQMASVHKHRSIIDYLLSSGANVNLQGGFYNTALQAAASTDDSLEIVVLLLRSGAAVNAQGGSSATALQHACSRGDMEMARFLIGCSANVDTPAQGNNHADALHIAVTRGDLDMVDLLLAAGANANTTAAEHSTALHAAVVNGHAKVTESLLHAGADVNLTWDGMTVLHTAALLGHADVVAILLSAGAHVAGADAFGSTPLFYASFWGHTKAAALLLSRSAEVNREGSISETMIRKAADNTGLDLASLQYSAEQFANFGDGDYRCNLLHLAVRLGYGDLIDLFLSAGADIDAVDNNGHTPLRIACDANDSSFVTKLIEAGADVDMPNWTNDTPLSVSLFEGRDEIVQLLLKAGANVYLDCSEAYRRVNRAILMHDTKALVDELKGLAIYYSGASQSSFQRALQLARTHGSEEIVQITEGFQSAVRTM